MKAYNYSSFKLIHLIAALGVLVCFFLPWVVWNGYNISGNDFPSGKFFRISASRFGLDNPFPQLSFSFYLFWLIPLLIILVLVRAFQNKSNSWFSLIASALTLSLVCIYYLFTSTLTDLGIGVQASKMMRAAGWLTILFSIILIASTIPPYNWLKKAGWILIGPLFAFSGFKIVERTVWNETFSNTSGIKPDYSVSALSLLREFEQNDSLANLKYREKIVQVQGNASAVEQLQDSTINIRFADSSGSYVIFSFGKDQYPYVKDVKEGDLISAKGSCSGSIYSEILGNTTINFKRSILNKKEK